MLFTKLSRHKQQPLKNTPHLGQETLPVPVYEEFSEEKVSGVAAISGGFKVATDLPPGPLGRYVITVNTGSLINMTLSDRLTDTCKEIPPF